VREAEAFARSEQFRTILTAQNKDAVARAWLQHAKDDESFREELKKLLVEELKVVTNG